jgi:hypothetical protein
MPQGYAAVVANLADELAHSDAERECLEEVRRLAGTTGGPLENHNVRVFRVAERLAERLGLKFDREVVLCAAQLHDVGLYPGAASAASYVEDGARLARRLLEPHDWPPARLKRCADAIERHHELRPQWKRGVEVELLRRADLVDVSGGLIALGAGRGWVRSLGREAPRRGFYREVGRLLVRAARDRPGTLPRIFRPG